MVVGRKIWGVGGLDLTLYRGVFLWVSGIMSKLLCIWERRSPNVTQGGRGRVGTRLGAPGYDPRPCMRPRVIYIPAQLRDACRACVRAMRVSCARVARCVRVRVIRFGFARLCVEHKKDPNKNNHLSIILGYCKNNY